MIIFWQNYWFKWFKTEKQKDIKFKQIDKPDYRRDEGGVKRDHQSMHHCLDEYQVGIVCSGENQALVELEVPQYFIDRSYVNVLRLMI